MVHPSRLETHRHDSRPARVKLVPLTRESGRPRARRGLRQGRTVQYSSIRTFIASAPYPILTEFSKNVADSEHWSDTSHSSPFIRPQVSCLITTSLVDFQSCSLDIYPQQAICTTLFSSYRLVPWTESCDLAFKLVRWLPVAWALRVLRAHPGTVASRLGGNLLYAHDG